MWYKRKDGSVTAASLESLYEPSFAQRCKEGGSSAVEMALNVFDECCQASAGLYELSNQVAAAASKVVCSLETLYIGGTLGLM